jgi:hypothetical protein
MSDRVTEAAEIRGELVKELQDLLDRAEAEHRPLTDKEQMRFDQLKKNIGSADTHLDNLRVGENLMARTAQRIGPVRDAPLEKGIAAARMVQLLLASKGNDLQAIEFAKRHFPDTP